jgi:hypothetical protein
MYANARQMLQETESELFSSTVGEHLSCLEEEDSEGSEYGRGPPAHLRRAHKALNMRERSLGAETQCGIVQQGNFFWRTFLPQPFEFDLISFMQD